jgi:hypothetical protein
MMEPFVFHSIREHMDLLTNSIQSICAGVEDYQEGSHARLLTAVRNIHAGILLMYKEALRRLSPDGSNEALVKAKIVPSRNSAGEVVFLGVGKKTADVQQIKDRFAELDISTDWARFDRITNVRNDIEHYYTEADKKALESVVSDAFVIIRNFLNAELKEDPLSLLGDTTWEAMLKISDVYEAERNECVSALAAVNWESETLREGVFELTCTSCSGSLLRPDGDYPVYTDIMGLQCRICGNSSPASDFVPRAIEEALGGEAYMAFKDGGDEPYTSCPGCHEESYVMLEQKCAHCGHSAEHTCQRCGNEIPASELMCAPLCGYCEHMMSKDD